MRAGNAFHVLTPTSEGTETVAAPNAPVPAEFRAATSQRIHVEGPGFTASVVTFALDAPAPTLLTSAPPLH